MYRKLMGLVFAGVTMTAVASCGLQEALDDAKAQVEEAAKQKLGEKGFELVVTNVTGAVLGVAMEAATGVSLSPAPKAFRLYAARTSEVSVTVDKTVQKEGQKGSITVKGTVKATLTADEEAKTGSLKISSDLASGWSGVEINADGQTYSSAGTTTIKGDMTYAVANSTVTLSGSIAQEGKFSLGSNAYDLKVTYTFSNTKVTFSGTINGKEFSGEFAITLPDMTDDDDTGGDDDNTGGDDDNNNGTSVGSCTTSNGGYVTCVDYTGSFYTAENVKSGCSNSSTYSSNPCPTANRIGRCTFGSGSITETVTSYYPNFTPSMAKQYCPAGTAVWQDN